jgi:hypothetical protein
MQMNARATSAALLEVEKNAAPEDEEQKPISKMNMSDLQKQYENRIDFYQDFYKSVPSYREFNPAKGYQDFIKRKSVAEERKREGLQKTEILY